MGRNINPKDSVLKGDVVEKEVKGVKDTGEGAGKRVNIRPQAKGKEKEAFRSQRRRLWQNKGNLNPQDCMGPKVEFTSGLVRIHRKSYSCEKQPKLSLKCVGKVCYLQKTWEGHGEQDVLSLKRGEKRLELRWPTTIQVKIVSKTEHRERFPYGMCLGNQNGGECEKEERKGPFRVSTSGRIRQKWLWTFGRTGELGEKGGMKKPFEPMG